MRIQAKRRDSGVRSANNEIRKVRAHMGETASGGVEGLPRQQEGAEGREGQHEGEAERATGSGDAGGDVWGRNVGMDKADARVPENHGDINGTADAEDDEET